MEFIYRFYGKFDNSRNFYVLIIAITCVHFSIRGLLYPAEASDGAEQLYFSQVFLLGYDIVNPPLYTWIMVVFHKLFGVTNVSVSLIKFLAYGLSFHFLYVLACNSIRDKRLCMLASLSPLWLYYMAWDAVLSYTHTVLATMFILACFTSLVRLRDEGNIRTYAIFGVVLGFGFVSKYTFAIAAIALLVSSLICAPYRAIILRPLMLVSLVIAVLIIAPHGYWLLNNVSEINSAVGNKFEVNAVNEFLFANQLLGLKSVITSIIGFISPLWLILLLVFWRPIRNRTTRAAALSPSTKLILTYIFLIIALLLAFVLVFGVTKVRAHYMFILIPLPVAFFAWLEPSLKKSRSPQVYAFTLITVAVLLVGGMTLKYLTEPTFCNRCQLLLPYKDIAQKIRASGFRGGTIFTTYFPHDLAGNFRSTFPNTRIVSTKFPSITRPLGSNYGQCLVIWMPAPMGNIDTGFMTHLTNKYFGSNIPVSNFPVKKIDFHFDRAPTRVGLLHYMMFDPGVGECR